jgi:hypothetical protein
MSARNLIRRWLGVPTREEIRAMILREIDADTAWKTDSDHTLEVLRRNAGTERSVAISFGYREDTRD